MKDGVLVFPAPQWHSLDGTYEELAAVADSWPITTTTPPPVAGMMATTRDLFSHTWFVYEFGLPAIAWSLVAVEAALRHRLEALEPNDRRTLSTLINQAIEREYLSEEWAERLDAARLLRNRVAHGRLGGVLSPGMLADLLLTAHAVVACVFPEDEPSASNVDGSVVED